MANSKAPARKFSSEKAKGYYKLNDEEPTFTARYLGMSKVEAMFPPEQGQTVSARCIDKLHCTMQRKSKRQKVSLVISSNVSRGLTVTEKGKKEGLCYKLFDIAYCSTDVRNKLIFSFIAECEGELQCHAFVFKTEERANAVYLTLSEAFNTAHAEWLRKQKREESRKERGEITAGTWGVLLSLIHSATEEFSAVNSTGCTRTSRRKPLSTVLGYVVPLKVGGSRGGGSPL